MVSNIYNNANMTVFEMPGNKTFQQRFSLPHWPDIQPIQQLIDILNRTTRKTAYTSTISKKITVEKSDLHLIILIMILAILLICLLLILCSFFNRLGRCVFKKKSFPISTKHSNRQLIDMNNGNEKKVYYFNHDDASATALFAYSPRAREQQLQSSPNTSMTFSDIFDVLDTDDNNNDSSMFLADPSKYYYYHHHHAFNFHMGLSDFEEEQEQELIYYENSSMMKVNDERFVSETIPKSHETDQCESSNMKDNIVQVTTTATDISVKKKLLYQNIHTTGSFDEPDSIPDYLLVENQLFDQMIEKLIDKRSSTDTEELRTFAFFQHELVVYRRLYHLWSLYLQAGRGELLKEDPTNDMKHSLRCYWTTHVKLSMSTSNRRLLLTSIANKEEHVACESFVHQRLEKYNNKIDYYQKQIDEKENNMTHCTDTIKQAIEKFVEENGERPIRMKCDFATGILYNNYKHHLLKIAYEQEKPTDYQVV
ncbi:unnamed protein product [Rotaria socialis]|uniref:Uncharacterized protein n=2 Tax=Rotaria socialis TaxID=392032 RepID=A0A818ZFV8_9BILA|nr:unnamed protein product [Rotaria socialis]CAF4455494.1 unnamed protein product [Rotaria socialis]CAF4477480.1 unnamed protein product [Rotaria socialis]